MKHILQSSRYIQVSLRVFCPRTKNFKLYVIDTGVDIVDDDT